MKKFIVLLFLIILIQPKPVFAQFYFDVFKKNLDQKVENTCGDNQYLCKLSKFFFPGYLKEQPKSNKEEDTKINKNTRTATSTTVENSDDNPYLSSNDENPDRPLTMIEQIGASLGFQKPKEEKTEYNFSKEDQQKYYESTGGKTWNSEDAKSRDQNYITPAQIVEFQKEQEFTKEEGNPTTREALAREPEQNMSLRGDNLITMNPGSFTGAVGNISELHPRIFTVLSEGWLQTNASIFGLNYKGGMDRTILPKYGCETAMSSFFPNPVKVCNTSTCVISLPREAINYYFGKVRWNNNQSQGVSKGTMYKKIAGTPIEIVNLSNKKCTVVPLAEIGPGKIEGMKNGFGTDLTYCVKNILLESRKPSTQVKYRPVPAGKGGCEDYKDTYVKAPVMLLSKEQIKNQKAKPVQTASGGVGI